VVEDDLREWFTIEGQSDPAIRKERADPVAQGWGKTQEAKDMDQAADVEVVEESLDVKKEESGNMTAFDTGLDCVDHA